MKGILIWGENAALPSDVEFRSWSRQWWWRSRDYRRENSYMPKCHRKITICYLRGCVDWLAKRCGFTGPLESHFIDWLKIKMCILLISFPSLSYLLIRLKMGSYFKGFVFLLCILHTCDADGKHFMTFPFVCSRTIFLSFSTKENLLSWEESHQVVLQNLHLLLKQRKLSMRSSLISLMLLVVTTNATTKVKIFLVSTDEMKVIK